jgi:zinc transporter ZupT
MSMSIDTVKLMLTWSILLMGMGSVFAPRKLTGMPWLFSLGNMMASGVLLSAGLVHQLAESATTLNVVGDFPWAMFVCGLTFLTFLVVEESLHLLLGEKDSHDAEHRHHDHHQHDHHHDHDGGGENEQPAASSSSLRTALHRHEMMHAHLHPVNPPKHDSTSATEDQPLLPVRHKGDLTAATPGPLCSHLPVAVSCGARRTLSPNHDDTTHCVVLEGGVGPLPPTMGSSSSSQRQFGSFLRSTKSHKEDPYQLQQHHHHDDHIDLHLHGSILASSILMMALSIHSILAGVSIGIEQDWNGIAGTAIAILAHKSFEGFCLGSSMVNAQMDHLPFWILGMSFSCATPLGILIGQFIVGAIVAPEENDGKTSTGIALVQAMVAGTFLYISIVEIGTKELLACRHELPESGDPHGGRQTQQTMMMKGLEAAKLVCFVLGFLAMSALAAFV